MSKKFTRLRELRRHFEMTQDDVARETGISSGYISRIERGTIDGIKRQLLEKELIKYLNTLKRMKRKEEKDKLNSK